MTDEAIEISKNFFIMASEPIPGLTADDIRTRYADDHDEANLASSFAAVNNKFCWVEDNIYDYDEGTEAYREAYEITKAWEKLMNELLAEIFNILRSENVDIPDKGWNTVVIPFMKRNGYEDCNGWWVPLKQEDEQ